MSEREEPSLTISESASLERGYRRLLVLVFTPPSNRYFRTAPELVSPAG
jgi:hypothetical protein